MFSQPAADVDALSKSLTRATSSHCPVVLDKQLVVIPMTAVLIKVDRTFRAEPVAELHS